MLNKLKLNQKGLAISGILYSILVLFLILLFSILALLASSKYTFDKLKNDVIDKLSENTETETLSSCFTFDTSTGTILDYNAASSSCPKAVVIPETIDDVAVKYIGAKAFKSKGLTSVDFSQAIYLKEIKGGTAETGAFASNNITKVKFGTLLNFTTFGGYDFYANQIAGTLDLRGLPNISVLPTKVFSKNKITGIDFSNNKKITEIGRGAFYQNKLVGELDLTPLTKLKKIGVGAFARGKDSAYYNEIASVKLDGLINLTTIDDAAFNANAITEFDFTKLSSLTTIGISAFSQNNLTKVDFSNCPKLTYVNDDAFSKNAITKLVIKNNPKLTKLGNYAFHGNVIEGELDLTGAATSFSLNYNNVFSENQITAVKYNGSMIGLQTFAKNNFSSIDFNLMPNITSIGEQAFASNDSLVDVNFEVLKKLNSIGTGAFAYCNIDFVSFPETITTISSNAFYSNAIEGVLDLSNVAANLSIGVLSFYDNLLTNVILPDSYTLNGGAFNKNNFSAERAHYTQQKTRTVVDDPTTGASHTEEYTELVSYASNNVDEVTIPAEIDAIGDYAYHNSGINKINFHSGIFKIGNYAFYGNDLGDVIDLSVSPNLETIGSQAFNCTPGFSIYSIVNATATSSGNGSGADISYTVSSRSTTSGSSCPAHTEGKELIVTGLSKLKSIGTEAFRLRGISTITGWEDLTALETIGQYAFASNYVTTMDFSTLKKLTSIGDYAFNSNSKLASVNFNGAISLTSIGSYAFSSCTALSTVDFRNLPALTKIYDYAFYQSPITSDIDFANSANLNLLSYAFYGNRCAGTINLANTALTSIGQQAFYTGTTGKTTTAKILLPPNATSIGSNAFYGINATVITWPLNLQTIYDYAFYYNGFTDLTIPSTVTSIGNYAFMGNDISTLSIPNSVKTIGSQAFALNKIENLTLQTTAVTYGGNVFESNNLISLDLSTFGNTSVASGMFRNNKITNLTLGSNITTIGSSAFYGNRMTDITIPLSVRTIGTGAFKQTDSYPWNSVTIEYNDSVLEGRFLPNWTRIGWPIEFAPDFSYPEVTLVTNEPNNFEYQGYYTKAVVDTAGYYKLETWGAEGGGSRLSSNSSSGLGGKGGYSIGYVNLDAGDTLYVYVGGYGESSTSGDAFGGFNGGGSAYASSAGEPGNGGGGASDIRIGQDSLYARVIVAGGGGGGGEDSSDSYGAGGGLTGTNSYRPGTQTSAGTNGAFGIGADTGLADGGAGGGGWYGGGTTSSTSIGSDSGGGGGGSGWIYTESNFNSWQSGNSTDAAKWLLDSKYYLSNADTLAGNTTFKSPTGTNETGHAGNGYVRITYVGTSLPS